MGVHFDQAEGCCSSSGVLYNIIYCYVVLILYYYHLCNMKCINNEKCQNK